MTSQPVRPVVVAVVKDGQANLYEANPLTGSADQLARIRVPADFPPERAVALTLAITGIVDDLHVVDVERLRPAPLPTAAQRALPQVNTIGPRGPSKPSRPSGGDLTLEAAREWAAARTEPFGGSLLASAFRAAPYLGGFRIKQMKKLGLIESTGDGRWQWVGTNGKQMELPATTKKLGRPPGKPGTTTPMYMRLVEEVRRHPEGITSTAIGQALNLDTTAVSANLTFAATKGFVRKVVAPHPDGNSSRKLATWYPIDQPSPVPTNGETAAL